MDYVIKSHRHAGVILNEPEFIDEFTEITEAISEISDRDLVEKHRSYGAEDAEKTPKSLSRCLNEIIAERLKEKGWSPESEIFKDEDYKGDSWRLDFAKKDISIEVAFNHGSVVAWNLLKPVLASELNHVEKAIQTKIGVIITATQELKKAGGFDGAVGTFERYESFLKPLSSIITAPVLLIGLCAPKSFYIEQQQLARRKKIGNVRYYRNEY